MNGGGDEREVLVGGGGGGGGLLNSWKCGRKHAKVVFQQNLFHFFISSFTTPFPPFASSHSDPLLSSFFCSMASFADDIDPMKVSAASSSAMLSSNTPQQQSLDAASFPSSSGLLASAKASKELELRTYISDLHAAAVSPQLHSPTIDKLTAVGTPSFSSRDDFRFSSPPTGGKQHGSWRSSASAPSKQRFGAVGNASIDSEDVTRTLRGSGSVHPGSRVQRRQDIVKVETRQFQEQMELRTNLRYYHQDPDRRTSPFKSGNKLSDKTWDRLPNEMPYSSTVPTASDKFPVKEYSSYRPLVETISTLDNVGTKAACPTHLLYNETAGKPDWSHVESKVSRIWSKLPKGQKARPSSSISAQQSRGTSSSRKPTVVASGWSKESRSRGFGNNWFR